MSLGLYYIKLAENFPVYAQYIDFLKILSSCKNGKKLTKNGPNSNYVKLTFNLSRDSWKGPYNDYF